jgi:hypothetical protein
LELGRKRCADLAGTGLFLLTLSAWATLGGGGGCLGPPAPPPGCLDNDSLVVATPSQRLYDYPVSDHTLDARNVDWVGQAVDGVDLEGDGDGCFVGGRIQGTWNQADSWDLYHGRKALPAGLGSYPLTVEHAHIMNFGDGAALELATPCPNGSPTWLHVRDSLLEDLHDDAVESDGLCSVEVDDTLIDRAYVAFAFRNRESQPNRIGSANTVNVRNNLVRMHAFANNYQGQTAHNGIWKWARGGRGPKVIVRNNRFLAFDAPPGGTLFPFVNRVRTCENNVLLFAGSEAEWQQALAGGCDDKGDDGLCDGERLLALASCYTVITKPDTQSEADFLAAHWNPHVATWKASHSADEE